MQKLYDNLLILKSKGQIHQTKFIQGANVPIIKLVADLQAINSMQVQRAKEERLRLKENGEEFEGHGEIELENKVIDSKMRYLKIDISIEQQTQD
mmetsp:Transcript_13166/g.22309  ORF Transcript_13166/g.22309 Transcript_13166/m.22309 type:complete len:95 (+) Transcript_13166:2-286(+)